MLAAIDMTEREAGQALRTLVVGLGATGLSCARFLSRAGVSVAVTDSRDQPPGLETLQRELPDVALFLGGFDTEAFARAERIIISPGVSLREPLVAEAQARGVEIIGDVELFARHVSAPIIGITGSNGKSTVTTLLGLMVQQAGRNARVGGNLGVPALNLIEKNEPDVYVLELSSFQLEAVQGLSCLAAVVLNISPDHMDRYDSPLEYAKAKQAIYRHARLQVVNRDDAVAATLAHQNAPVVGFTVGEPRGCDYGVRQIGGALWVVHGDTALMSVAELRMPGRHNLANALAALALGDALGLPVETMLRVLRVFQGLPHRTEWVGEYEGVRWFNDSKATNIGAALAAVQGFDGPLVLIAGGQGKGADFSELATGLDLRVRHVILLGEAAGEIEAALRGKISASRAIDMPEAVQLAAAQAQPGDTVLLSPACASFDMFSSYQQRGESFVQALQEVFE
ncbi:UDP-N-acetylmuramoylalanine--D-glutamate ligase [hydrothermal vent metagenome]|uniref:UDP-N-acetylmuramoylalanine--D-glutamate ligase n=1 Tax=hydrothermal vent metagenome TaxID=652676 RepID=A0A3B0YIE2_9ZZZZ